MVINRLKGRAEKLRKRCAPKALLSRSIAMRSPPGSVVDSDVCRDDDGNEPTLLGGVTLCARLHVLAQHT
jgi:hypothetical protein